jgi:hypothetical protein
MGQFFHEGMKFVQKGFFSEGGAEVAIEIELDSWAGGQQGHVFDVPDVFVLAVQLVEQLIRIVDFLGRSLLFCSSSAKFLNHICM